MVGRGWHHFSPRHPAFSPVISLEKTTIAPPFPASLPFAPLRLCVKFHAPPIYRLTQPTPRSLIAAKIGDCLPNQCTPR